ncbi:RNA-directed DNA polymerase from mobile element jockey [Trichonephila clavipes]|nr:RNA-directed DNA polymerase from mobile element jockey [Trichonephila clavipes]
MFLVQETWLEPGIDPQIANYRLTKDDRIEIPHTVTRGGTAIHCKNEIVHHRVPLPNLQRLDATAVQIKINNFPPINIVSAYVRRKVGHNFPIEHLKKIFNCGINCIIAGDYNAAHVSWHNAKSTRYGQALHKLIRDLRGAKLVAPQTATHLQPRQRFGSVIDLAVFKHIPFNHSVRVLNDLSFDHYPKPLPTVELTSNENIELAISELNQNFTEAFVEASKPKFKNAPKILSPEIKFKIYERNRLRKFWQRTRCPSIYSEFRTLSRALGSIAITPIEKAEVIADSLQEQFEPNHVVGRELFDQRIHDEVTNFINTPHVQEIEPTTPTEVLSYVQRLKPRKSPGLDQISNLRVDKTLSSPRPIRSGLPQGSLSLPLLFTLYVNDVPQTDLSHLAMFADDTVIITQNKRFSVVISNLQHYISLLELWLTDWIVKVNASKSACLMFTRRPRLPVGLTPVQIFGQPVPWVHVAKYLGLFLDAKLTFAHHIEQTRKKAQAVHAVLKRLISRRSKLAIRHKVLLYKSIIRPVMSYGSQIWGSAGMCHLKKLHTLTNSFLRQIVNVPWFVRNEVIYRDLKIKPFLPHIKDLSKRFFDKLPSVPNELISNQPAYDPAVPSSQKRPRALLDHEFINFPQAKRLRV